MITSALALYQDPGSADPKLSPRTLFAALAVYLFIFPTTSRLRIQQAGLGEKRDGKDDGDHDEKRRSLGDLDEEALAVEAIADVGMASQQGVSESSAIDVETADNHKDDSFEKDEELNNALLYLTLAVCWLDFSD